MGGAESRGEDPIRFVREQIVSPLHFSNGKNVRGVSHVSEEQEKADGPSINDVRTGRGYPKRR